MQASKILPIAIGLTGVGIFVLAISKSIKGKNSVVYLDDTGAQNEPLFDAKSVADTLHEAMKSAGTDEDMIFEALTGISAMQFASVIKAFGYRLYNTYTGTSYMAVNKYPLKTWLKEELSESDYKTLKNNFPKQL